jgi:hypothetical protein
MGPLDALGGSAAGAALSQGVEQGIEAVGEHAAARRFRGVCFAITLLGAVWVAVASTLL